MRRILTIFVFSLTLISLTGGDKKTPSLAIYDFTDDEGDVTNDGEKFAMLLFAKLAKSGKVNLIERAQIEKIIQEQLISGSGKMKDPLKLGKLLGADYVLFGKIYRLDNEYVLNCKVINCRNGKVSGISESYKSLRKENAIEDFVAKSSAHVNNLTAEK